VDSGRDAANRATGRSLGGKPLSPEHTSRVFDLLRRHGVRTKLNTVVNATSWDEDMTDLVLGLKRERWKVFQVLRVVGQNDASVDDLLVAREQFDRFVARHRRVGGAGIRLVPESNELMTGSYVMVDPSGRFFDNVEGAHRYSRPILDAGVAAALEDVRVVVDTFERREGLYDWRPLHLLPLGRTAS
jgi:radical S-adenosyl methionine domain-containing protein 2